MRRVSRLSLFAAALVALGQAGCVMLAATAVGGGAVGLGIAQGTVSRTFDAPVAETATATESALRDSELPVERPRIGANYGEIDSTLAGGAPVLLTLKADRQTGPSDPPKTKVSIHIRVFGDKQTSERILDQISYRLKNPAPPPPPRTTLPPPPSVDQTPEPELAKPTQ